MFSSVFICFLVLSRGFLEALSEVSLYSPRGYQWVVKDSRGITWDHVKALQRTSWFLRNCVNDAQLLNASACLAFLVYKEPKTTLSFYGRASKERFNSSSWIIVPFRIREGFFLVPVSPPVRFEGRNSVFWTGDFWLILAVSRFVFCYFWRPPARSFRRPWADGNQKRLP